MNCESLNYYSLACGKSIVFLLSYIGLCFVFTQKINNKFFRSILIGLTTSFFTYNFLIDFVVVIFGYSIYVECVNDYGTVGALLGILHLIIKPLSILMGIIVTIFLWFKDPLIKMLEADLDRIIEAKRNNK